MRAFVWITVAAVCLALGGIAYATPSTLIWVPSTDIQPAGTMHFGTDVYAPSEGSTLTDLGLTFGTGRVEYGVDLLSMNGIQSPVRLNAKTLLRHETASSPRMVAGIMDFGGGAASGMVYLLGSKTLRGTRATFGFCVGKKSVLGSDNAMLILGLDRTINSKWWAGADYQSGESAFGALSIGIGYNFTPSRGLILGYDWYNDASLSDTLTVQLDANF